MVDIVVVGSIYVRLLGDWGVSILRFKGLLAWVGWRVRVTKARSGMNDSELRQRMKDSWRTLVHDVIVMTVTYVYLSTWLPFIDVDGNPSFLHRQ